MDLTAIQQHFKETLLTDEVSDLSVAICQQGDMSKQERAAVYRNNMISGLANTLKQIYPVCRKQLTDPLKYLCISRQRWDVTVTEIEEDVYHLLAAIQQGRPLENSSTQCARIDILLPQLIQQKWLCGFVS